MSTTTTVELSVCTHIGKEFTHCETYYVNVTPEMRVKDVKEELIEHFKAFSRLTIDDIVISCMGRKLDNFAAFPVDGNFLRAYPICYSLEIYVRKVPKNVKTEDDMVPIHVMIHSQTTVNGLKSEIIDMIPEFRGLHSYQLELSCTGTGGKPVLTSDRRLPVSQPSVFAAYPLCLPKQ